ncbi:type IV toxin-antitoxin system AbiEi family antitoxin domain-containing protein [Nocardioides sp. cx-169]|uniref:type IV toxin-antitoxin system AbiEi family antitoxin domain-containing protein n=1 Tax=Nocardioides sp. cx-169 TaxID=2899080 RepID=UPI001E3E2A33|nr:type IV toxin-antitoxin system AbiEi family antitoxin domain-containing protein [Nocardioides sp. cx-169]MCD4536101.1 type IV toxin-antitoxin system AbiEi family antitoxin domain-containing protein [Nocardioides sp. cx-169]
MRDRRRTGNVGGMLDALLGTGSTQGFLLRRDAVALGIDDNALARLVRIGELVRIRQGVYAPRREWSTMTRRQRHGVLTRAVQALYRDHVVVSHTSQAIADGAPDWGVDLSSVHLTHLSGGGRRSAGVVHHEGSLRVVDVTRSPEGWRTTPTRTVLDSCNLVGTEAGLVLANWYLHEGLTSVDQLEARYVEMQRSRRMLAVRLVLRLANGRVESVGESRLLYLIWRAGLPMPIVQWEVWDGDRLVGTVDFAWPELGLMAEFDGKVKYGRLLRPGQDAGDAVFAEKRREDELREVTGCRMIRPIWVDLDRPDTTAERIRRMLKRAA